jgi:D-sedoheptulose 7-phosphate isomerase
MDLNLRAAAHIEENIAAKKIILNDMVPDMVRAGLVMAKALKNGNKILCCGNGGSAADAQHFSAELLGRFESERPSLAAIALTTDTSTITAIGNDYSFDQIFAKQIAALAKPKDILLAISTSGNSANITYAVEEAHSQQMDVIGLSGKSGGALADMLMSPNDVGLCIPVERTARIQECHILILHILCDIIDNQLFS